MFCALESQEIPIISIVADGQTITAETTISGNPEDITPSQINKAVTEVLYKAAIRVRELDSNRYSVGRVRVEFDLTISNDVAVHVDLLDINEEAPVFVNIVEDAG